MVLIPFWTCKNGTTNFIPKGYVEFEKHLGDLNNDGLEDCVLIVKKKDTANITRDRFNNLVDRNRRGIIVLFKNNNSYEKAIENYNCFSSENEDGGIYFPPSLTINIKNEKLIIDYNHGRYGSWYYTFQFQNSNFELIEFHSSSNQGPVINKETYINFITKKKLIKENINYNAVGGDEEFKETWSNVEIKSLIKLSEIEDFDELNMYKY